MADIVYDFLATTPENKITTTGGVAHNSSTYISKVSYIATSATQLQTALNKMYVGSTLEGQVTGVGNYGWQKFVCPKSGEIVATVRGGSGAVSCASSATINAVTGAYTGRRPGRGAKLVGSFKVDQGDVLYLLVGMRGLDHSGKSNGGWGASGGGASILLRENPNGDYTLTPANTKVDVLIVAGGGGGSASDHNNAVNPEGKDAVITDGVNTNGGVWITSSNKTGGGAGLTGAGAANATANTGYPALLSGKIPSMAGTVSSVWGGGGSPQVGGGGGGGYSGGNTTSFQGGDGGTSYMHPTLVTQVFRGYATVAEDSNRDLVNPWNAYGNIELVMKDNDKYILAEDNGQLKFFKGTEPFEGDAMEGADNTWHNVPDDFELSVANYLEYGRFSISSVEGLTNGVVRFLSMSPAEETSFNVLGKVNRSIIKQTSDVNLADVSLIKSLSFTGNTNIANIQFAISKNSGKTWQTFNGTTWIDINIEDRDEFYNNGYNMILFTAIPAEAWNSYNPKYIRFAFCVTQTANSTSTIIDAIELVGDLTGSWRKALESEATYEYTSIDNLKVNFAATGNYKVNYLDNLSTSEE